MANDDKTVYLPRMKVRPGFRHSYQGDNVVVVDANGKQTKAKDDHPPKAATAKVSGKK